ncbi:Aerobactin synthase [Corynebacterium heidelbergense]|uniref:Lysine N-acyltransferase MbtK n=1 Tax=Corynebacterium heidelbergense TaxID=2055947 RepID=A0A364VDL2_9CORY|nr:siderophore synthetase [Corynebacterium heidelbergense]WCZ37331.1 Aerobactin synthase [Corynebacterium heidelbergense]
MLVQTQRVDHVLTSTAGLLTFRPLRVDGDITDVHAWVTHPKSAFWGAQGASEHEVAEEYERIHASAEESAWIVERAGAAIALVETYDPGQSVLGEYVAAGTIPGAAVGMHVLVAPPEGAPEPGLTSCIFAAVMRWLVDVHGADNVVVEPDAANDLIIAKNAAAGFVDVPGLTAVSLPFGDGTKTARVQVCSAGGFHASALASHATARFTAPAGAAQRSAHHAVPPLDPGAQHLVEHGAAMHRILLAKALREFIHERLLVARPIAPERHEEHDEDQPEERLSDRPSTFGAPREYEVDFGGRHLRFTARPYPLEHLKIDPHSIRARDGQPVHLLTLIAAGADQLGLGGDYLHTYLAEVQATLATRTRASHRPRPSAATLGACPSSQSGPTDVQRATYLQFVEGSMVEGHPGFVANAGRGGMGESELEAYAPELGDPFQVVWLAARRADCVTETCADYGPLSGCGQRLMGAPMWHRFCDTLRSKGHDPEDFAPLPVHPWQWDNRIVSAFAQDLAAGKLIYIGPGLEIYRPQQSLRTLLSMSDPTLPYVKTATAVRNMGFTRGLSPAYMSNTPTINDWLQNTVAADHDFTAHNVRLLREVATVGYVGDVYHGGQTAESGEKTAYQKMLAGLWRESPIPLLSEGCVAATLAGILHCDDHGFPLVGAWIERSGRNAREWVAAMLRVYLRPTIRALDEYALAFMPHSENVILELRDGFPVGSFFKDLGEEVAVLRADYPLPEECERIREDKRGTMTDEERALSVQTDVLDGVLRHLCAIMDANNLLAAEDFWHLVRECVLEYARDFPGIEERLPLLAPDFPHSCLNRLQLRNPTSMVDLGDQNASLVYAGRIDNPLYRAEAEPSLR